MTTSNPHAAGLDPAHILGVANKAVGGAPRTAHAVAIAGCVRVHLPSRRKAERAAAALNLVGYQTARIKGGSRQEFLVPGWNPAALESRLDVMRVVLHQLDGAAADTAAAVIDRVRSHPARLPAPADAVVLDEAGDRLREWAACSGIRAPHDPTILPNDLATALPLRVVRRLEASIDDCIEYHLRFAKHALTLFGSLRQHTTDDQAQEAAIRRAGATLRLNTSPPRNPSAQKPGTTRPPGPRPGPPFPRSDSAGLAPAGPAQLSARGFPRPINDAVSTADSISQRSTRSGGRHFPAGRLSPRR